MLVVSLTFVSEGFTGFTYKQQQQQHADARRAGVNFTELQLQHLSTVARESWRRWVWAMSCFQLFNDKDAAIQYLVAHKLSTGRPDSTTPLCWRTITGAGNIRDGSYMLIDLR
jgi:hypothetical protein